MSDRRAWNWWCRGVLVAAGIVVVGGLAPVAGAPPELIGLGDPVLDIDPWPELEGARCEEGREVASGVRCGACELPRVPVLWMWVRWMTFYEREGKPPARGYWVTGKSFTDLLGILMWEFGQPRVEMHGVRFHGDPDVLVGALLDGAEYVMSWEVRDRGKTYRISVLSSLQSPDSLFPCHPKGLKEPSYQVLVELVSGEEGEGGSGKEGGGEPSGSER